MFQVLSSADTTQWKITDFGYSSIGSSKRVLPSVISTGTPGYRAPELLHEEDAASNKSTCGHWGAHLAGCSKRTGKTATSPPSFDLRFGLRGAFENTTSHPRSDSKSVRCA